MMPALRAAVIGATVRRLLRDHGRPLHEADLLDSFRGRADPDDVLAVLAVLLKNGLIEQPAPGWWSAS